MENKEGKALEQIFLNLSWFLIACIVCLSLFLSFEGRKRADVNKLIEMEKCKL